MTVETRWMEGKGQFVNEFALDISLLMEELLHSHTIAEMR
jgi:hypothetical protein